MSETGGKTSGKGGGSAMPLWLGLAAAIVLFGTVLFGSPKSPVTSLATGEAPAAAPAQPAATGTETTTTTTSEATAPAQPGTGSTAATTTTEAQAPAAGTTTTAVNQPAPAPAPAATEPPKPDVPVEELMKPASLPENVMGEATAPVTIVEYASMTCPHCADFHKRVFPELKAKYIDTGKVRMIFREYPLDNVAAAVSMLARCSGPVRYFAFVGVMFERQEEWVTADEPIPKLKEFSKQAGFTDESFQKCVSDQKLLDGINEVRGRANDKFGVSSTPTFFINGVKLKDGHDLTDFEAAFKPFLKG